MTFVIPIACFIVEHLCSEIPFSFDFFCKWFIFSAVGLRLLVAGLVQSIKPSFTAEQIFHIENPESFPIVRELGFANICFGLVGIISLFLPEWREVSAFGSGLYYGFAAVQHLIRKPENKNERFALITDIVIFMILIIYLVVSKFQ